jgi:TRAP-type C4-dicarboxylate transport system permease small subunit
MEKKTVGIIATIVAVLLCGCPGLCLCLFGALTAAGAMPYTTDMFGVQNAGTIPTWWGIVALCVALIFILIPILVGIFTLRNKPASKEPVSSEPIPPVS